MLVIPALIFRLIGRFKGDNDHQLDFNLFFFLIRSKLVPEPPKTYTYLAPGVDFRPETSPYFPKDFDIECPPHDGMAQAPQ